MRIKWLCLKKLPGEDFKEMGLWHFNDLKMSQLHFSLQSLFSLFSELFYDRGNHHEFTSLVRDLAPPGELTQSTNYDFEFVNVEKPYETYTGANVRLR